MHCERFDGPEVEFVAQSKPRSMGHAVMIHWRVCQDPPRKKVPRRWATSGETLTAGFAEIVEEKEVTAEQKGILEANLSPLPSRQAKSAGCTEATYGR